MYRLSSRSRAAGARASASLLAIAGLVASVGCSPAEDDRPLRSALDHPTAQSSRRGDNQSVASRTDDPAERVKPRRATPSGNIPVDDDGFVTFGKVPEPASAQEQVSEHDSDQVSAQASQAAADRAAEQASIEPPEPAAASAPVSENTTAGENASAAPTPAADPTPADPTPADPTPADPTPADPTPAADNTAELTLGTPTEIALSGKPTPAGADSSSAQPGGDASAEANTPLGEERPATVKAQTVSSEAEHSSESGLATYDERHQKIAEDWPKPQAVLFLTGQQHGYIEPCGCTGLENQKGGLNRRDTLLRQLRDRGWETLPMDVGNFERRVGRQAEIKFQASVEALTDMEYRAATLGVDDLKLSSTHLLSLTATEGKTETPFVSANAYILIEEYMPKSKIIEAGGRKIGVTAVLGDSFREDLSASDDVLTAPAAESLKPVVAELKKAGCDYLVLLAHATDQESRQLAQDIPGFDLVVTAGGFPEPPFELESIEGTDTKLAQVGAKGMYTVLIGLYPDSKQPVRYQRVALSSQFADSPRMLERFASYQKQLESLGFEGLGLRAATHPTGREFVGSETCGQCHSKAFEVWQGSKHFAATESLVKPPNDRSMIPRHHDPECLSCHVTGWNPQHYYPYATGYVSLKKTPLLTGSGCENCHGPGSAHVAAENGDVEADAAVLEQLREQMRLPLAEARAKCTECHDQDNSPDFQHDGAFEKYWEQIAHPGKD